MRIEGEREDEGGREKEWRERETAEEIERDGYRE